MPFMPILVYTSRAFITADFREMSSDEFKERYLAPLDKALRESNLSDDYLSKKYRYPFGDAIHVE
ncbi:DEHA2D00242p [Debaryomyces hansenii CBS767]|uniref:DEHA2D00242p n=1 Tax=Debaryomyces hansenii (strain ATCC 36239 / CBS 767 / BCRC 21394 / JCM 1990 / NBRC 0083 / IGC 2968) TaxID=284592 RepID=Q6BTJ0_DEBHA|nr:DEHA2D00242p [Debaryomyces hansenii CBS767]CAG86562.1 DEHA2D00242p [Debaryomyces hansenii CBS767]|eukprot:XP_458479.1 DEHA2D00242p [Debaryomyces hansenii CBS767]